MSNIQFKILKIKYRQNDIVDKARLYNEGTFLPQIFTLRDLILKVFFQKIIVLCLFYTSNTLHFLLDKTII